MSLELLSAFAGAAQGLEKSSNNLMNIMIAKHEIEQKNKLFDIQKKKGELDIKESEFTQSPDVVAARKEKFMLDTQLGKLQLEKAGLDIKQTETKIKQEKQQYETQMNVVMPLLQGAFKTGGKLPPGFTLRSDGSFSMSGGPVKKEETSFDELLQSAPASSENEAESFSPEVEDYVQKAMDTHGKTREEVIQALKDKGAI